MSATTAKLWGVGCYRAGDSLVSFPVSAGDVARDIGSAVKAMRSLGVKPGSRVLVISRMSEAAQYYPVQAGVLASGAQLSTAEATRFDAYRTALFLRRLRYDTVVGVDPDLLDGLADIGVAPEELFGDVPVVAARAGASGRLRAAGLVPRRWLHLGPTLAVECDRLGGAHVDGDEWAVDVADGEVLVSARRPRAASVERAPTGVRGRVATGPCACGRADPRIVVEEGAQT